MGNTIGGTSPADRNVISGNGFFGVSLFFEGEGDLIAGNFIGTDATGERSLGQQSIGVDVELGAANVTIGGLVPGAGNVISGNVEQGIDVGGATHILIAGNDIGVAASGGALLGPNAFGGIQIDSSSNITIGGTTAAARNIVSGSSDIVPGKPGAEISLSGGSNNVVQGNYIGTNAAGTQAVANDSDGIDVAAETGDLIGGTSPGAGNLISGNAGFGIAISGSSAPGTTVQGNTIGTDATGNQALGNGNSGVSISSPNNTIGGSAPGAGNLISGNNAGGQPNVILTGAGAENNLVQGNLIGPARSGAPLSFGGAASPSRRGRHRHRERGLEQHDRRPRDRRGQYHRR